MGRNRICSFFNGETKKNTPNGDSDGDSGRWLDVFLLKPMEPWLQTAPMTPNSSQREGWTGHSPRQVQQFEATFKIVDPKIFQSSDTWRFFLGFEMFFSRRCFFWVEILNYGCFFILFFFPPEKNGQTSRLLEGWIKLKIYKSLNFGKFFRIHWLIHGRKCVVNFAKSSHSQM